MNIIDDIRNTTKDILSDTATGFATECIFSVTSGVTVVSVSCGAVCVKHNLTFDDMGAPVNSPTVRVTVSELTLAALDYPVRNTSNAVALKGHRVTFSDLTGEQATYVVSEQFPNAQTGVIRLQMASYRLPTPPGRTIIGWIVGPVKIQIVTTPNGTTQTLANGDVIPIQYALNSNGSLTIPGIAGYNVLTPFMLSNFPIQDMPYTLSTGTFNYKFTVGREAAVNVSLPLYAD